jgi:hypothetical protein
MGYEDMNWVEMAWGRVLQWASENIAINFRFTYKIS